MDAGFGEWFVSETPLMNNLPEVFRSNHFWGIWRKNQQK
jgi:hypothetical protein